MGVFETYPTHSKSILSPFNCVHAFNCFNMTMFRLICPSMIHFHYNSTEMLQITVTHHISYSHLATSAHPLSQLVRPQESCYPEI